MHTRMHLASIIEPVTEPCMVDEGRIVILPVLMIVV